MSYSAVKGKVTPIDEVPPEEEENSSHSTPELPLTHRCEHGYYITSACPECQKRNYSVRDTRACSLLEDKTKTTVKAINNALYAQNLLDIKPWSIIPIGTRVVRRIRPNEIGVVKRLTYAFTDSHMIKDIWIEFGDKGRQLPYTPDELQRVKVQ